MQRTHCARYTLERDFWVQWKGNKPSSLSGVPCEPESPEHVLAHTSTSDTGLKEMWVQRESSYSWERDIERYTNREKSSRGMGKARPMLEALLAFALWVTSRREQVQDSYSWARALLPHKPWGVAVSMTYCLHLTGRLSHCDLRWVLTLHRTCFELVFEIISATSLGHRF